MSMTARAASQPVDPFSFVKTGANAWAYEATYAGDGFERVTLQSALEPPARCPSTTDGSTEANVNGASPASGNINADHSLVERHRVCRQPGGCNVNLGTVSGSTSGLTQYRHGLGA